MTDYYYTDDDTLGITKNCSVFGENDYHGLNYNRSNNDKISNIPPNQNTQLNIDTSDCTIYDSSEKYDGRYLSWDDDTKSVIFGDALISFTPNTESNTSSEKWAVGTYASIKSYVNKYLTMIKQKIIQDIIQKTIDDHDSNQEYGAIYNNVMQATATSIDTNVKNNLNVIDFVLLGKTIDLLLNNLFDYTIRQSINERINNIAQNLSIVNAHPEIRKITHETLALIHEKNMSRINLSNTHDSIKIIQLLLNTPNANLINYEISQIEPNPNILDYNDDDVEKEKKFIKYIYDIDYTPITTDVVKNCRQITPSIIQKIITPENINMMNSDGKTALHFAVEMRNSDIMKILLDRGSKSLTTKDIHSMTPIDEILNTMQNHLSFSTGKTLISTIDNFVKSMNNLLIERLNTDAYGNNVIKNASSCIPIQLAIYNHMFLVHVSNYRFGYDAELKSKITMLVNKYLPNAPLKNYPLDLFIIENIDDFVSIMKIDSNQNKGKSTVSTHYNEKINIEKQKLQNMNIELSGFINELDGASDPKEITQLEKIISKLELNVSLINTKINKYKSIRNNNKINPNVRAYDKKYASIINAIDNDLQRGRTVTEFYDYAFGKITKNKNTHVKIWNLYLLHDIHDRSSMIFSVINFILNKIIAKYKLHYKQPLNQTEINELQLDLLTIRNFYNVAKKYIGIKKNNKLSEDSNIKEEFTQLKYLINMIISPAVINIIINQSYKMISEKISLNDPDDIIEKISNAKFANNTIESYVNNVLPTIAIKLFTDIYESVSDIDKNNITSTDLFTPILDIIKANGVVVITDDDDIVKNFNNYMVPFFANTYQNIIHHLKLVIYGYEKYILETDNLIDIVYSLFTYSH